VASTLWNKSESLVATLILKLSVKLQNSRLLDAAKILQEQYISFLRVSIYFIFFENLSVKEIVCCKIVKMDNTFGFRQIRSVFRIFFEIRTVKESRLQKVL
jgi:hypothetical protein